MAPGLLLKEFYIAQFNTAWFGVGVLIVAYFDEIKLKDLPL